MTESITYTELFYLYTQLSPGGIIVYFYCLQLGSICARIIRNKIKTIVICLKRSKLNMKL
jgi:hypothetical protein